MKSIALVRSTQKTLFALSLALTLPVGCASQVDQASELVADEEGEDQAAAPKFIGRYLSDAMASGVMSLTVNADKTGNLVFSDCPRGASCSRAIQPVLLEGSWTFGKNRSEGTWAQFNYAKGTRSASSLRLSYTVVPGSSATDAKVLELRIARSSLFQHDAQRILRVGDEATLTEIISHEDEEPVLASYPVKGRYDAVSEGSITSISFDEQAHARIEYMDRAGGSAFVDADIEYDLKSEDVFSMTLFIKNGDGSVLGAVGYDAVIAHPRCLCPDELHLTQRGEIDERSAENFQGINLAFGDMRFEKAQ